MRTLVALIAAASVALVVACASGRMYSAKPEMVQARPDATEPPPPLGGSPAELRAKITELSDQIEAARTNLGTEAPTPDAMSAMTGVAPEAAAQTCARSQRDLCLDVCKLGDSICDNAKSICELALQLPGDAWAAERCNAGKASCKTASAKCCAC